MTMRHVRTRPTTLTTTLLALTLSVLAWPAAAQAASSVSLRSEVEVSAAQVTLADVARLRGDYASELGDVVVAEFSEGQAELSIAMADIRRRLDAREVHWGLLVCRGARNVTVRKVEPRDDERQGRPAEANPINIVAADDDEATTGGNVRERLHRWIAEQVGGGDEVEVKLTFDDADAPLLNAPLRGQRLEFEPLTTHPVGRVPITVRRYTGDELAGTDRLRVDVEIRRPVVVARRSLARGQVITEDHLETRTVTLTSLRKKPLTDPASAVGQQSEGLLRAGAVMYVDDVAAPVLVRRGQTVTVRAMSGGVVLRMVGRAMDDGERGAVVELRNERTRETFEARVTGPQEAVLNLDEDATIAQQEVGR